MFGRNRVNSNSSGESEADLAVQKSWEDYEAVQALKSDVADTVKGHLKLQMENHFSERIWLAYRGDY